MRRAIELDYGMRNGAVTLSSRICLSWNLERHLGLDLEQYGVLPQRQQIVQLNRDEVKEARAKAKGASE